MNGLTLTISFLRDAYDLGAFPMAENSDPDAEIFWSRPKKRAVLLPSGFHVPKRLARLIRQEPFEIRWNENFAEIMRQCGLEREEGSWINQVMIDAYTEWHKAGEVFCLSVHKDGELVGGVYGVQRGGVFMAESMFSRLPNASSVAVVVLMAGLVKAGIELVDVQSANTHSAKFNIMILRNETYMQRLAELKSKPVILDAENFNYHTTVKFLQERKQS